MKGLGWFCVSSSSHFSWCQLWIITLFLGHVMFLYLQWRAEPHVERQTCGTCPLHLETEERKREGVNTSVCVCVWEMTSHSFVIVTCGESLNMAAHTISGVEWCLAASARVCVPFTALNPPLARTVCVPMITWDTHTRYTQFFQRVWFRTNEKEWQDEHGRKIEKKEG